MSLVSKTLKDKYGSHYIRMDRLFSMYPPLPYDDYIQYMVDTDEKGRDFEYYNFWETISGGYEDYLETLFDDYLCSYHDEP